VEFVVESFFGLFTSAFVSATLLPGSSEALLTYMVLQGTENPYMLLAFATAGNVIGSAVNWACGAFLMTFQDRRWFPVTRAQIEKASRWYEKFGIWSLLLSWAPVIGDPITVIAGILRVSFWKFLIIVTFAKLTRYWIVIALALAWL